MPVYTEICRNLPASCSNLPFTKFKLELLKKEPVRATKICKVQKRERVAENPNRGLRNGRAADRSLKCPLLPTTIFSLALPLRRLPSSLCPLSPVIFPAILEPGHAPSRPIDDTRWNLYGRPETPVLLIGRDIAPFLTFVLRSNSLHVPHVQRCAMYVEAAQDVTSAPLIYTIQALVAHPIIYSRPRVIPSLYVLRVSMFQALCPELQKLSFRNTLPSMSYSRATAGKASPNQDLPPFAFVVDAIGVPASLHRDAPHQVGVANSQTFTTSAVRDSSIGVVSAKFWHGVFEQVRAYPGIGGFRWASSPPPPLSSLAVLPRPAISKLPPSQPPRFNPSPHRCPSVPIRARGNARMTTAPCCRGLLRPAHPPLHSRRPPTARTHTPPPRTSPPRLLPASISTYPMADHYAGLESSVRSVYLPSSASSLLHFLRSSASHLVYWNSIKCESAGGGVEVLERMNERKLSISRSPSQFLHSARASVVQERAEARIQESGKGMFKKIGRGKRCARELQEDGLGAPFLRNVGVAVLGGRRDGCLVERITKGSQWASVCVHGTCLMTWRAREDGGGTSTWADARGSVATCVEICLMKREMRTD
ncbi:hypothetical protein C8F04DRAFT_1183794 [Mycena alexandri]|uniref:Uncharacterized protein n=1 Tax=Mycena alexandri TaxID=1745969 RepID=A0AAD6X249_9AGAR|nr:hypothetical protein C8F04DRAFT_1183794 [Mycena alexandri]